MCTLYFEEPSDNEVRVQWFAIMLGDQILCSSAAARKFPLPKKRASKTKESGKQQRSESPSCLTNISRDPLLEFTLSPEWLDKNGRACMEEIVNYAKNASLKMEKYMVDAYNTLLKTEDHLYMMAAMFFYASWLCTFDPQTGTITQCIPAPPNSFLSTYLVLDETTKVEICSACYAFERGQNQMTSFSSFVHTLVTNHFKRVF